MLISKSRHWGLHLTQTIILLLEEDLAQIYQNYTHLFLKYLQMLLNHLSHTITEVGSSDKWAQFEVIILDKEKIYHKFNWQVEKYTDDGPLKGCWLTTMVSSPVSLGSSI